MASGQPSYPSYPFSFRILLYILAIEHTGGNEGPGKSQHAIFLLYQFIQNCVFKLQTSSFLQGFNSMHITVYALGRKAGFGVLSSFILIWVWIRRQSRNGSRHGAGSGLVRSLPVTTETIARIIYIVV